MAPYEQRQTLAQQSREKLAEIVKLGTDSGAFIVVKAHTHEGDAHPSHVRIETADGLPFFLSAGGWNRDGKISASVGEVDRDGIRVTTSELWGDVKKNAPTAQESCDKPAPVLLKNLTRRVIAHPDGIAAARAVVERWTAQIEARGGLRAMLAKLEPLGYVPHNLRDDAATSADLYRKPASPDYMPYRVQARGESLSVELSCTVEQFARILAILKPAN